MFVCVFGVFVVVQSSSHAKAGDAEGGIIVFVLLWYFFLGFALCF